MFDLGQLRCFVAVAEELHFGRAAARLNMTQPPLSRQIQVLEHILEVKVLERTSRAVRLTPAGRNFLPEAKRILNLAEGAAQVARRIAAGKSGSIKLGFTATTAYSYLPKLMTACRKKLPDVDFSLHEMVSGEQFEALTSGALDVGLLRPPIARPDFISRRVATEGLLAAVPEKHPLASERFIAMKDFDNQPFIMYLPFESRYFYDLLVAQFARADILPRYVQHLSQVHSVLAMVRAGQGLAIVPAAAGSLNVSGVALRPLKLPSPTPVELFMTWRREDSNPLIPALVELAVAMAPKGRVRD
jgi:DNA-binding transcriptional LysR family regulator